MDSRVSHSIIDQVPRLHQSILPTPLYQLKNLSSDLGINLYCKRDDLTGFAMGGNKTRKLDFLVQDALDKEADCIVTWGANQSNWCRMTAAAGAVNGLAVYLILAGKEPESPTGNLLLDHLAGASIKHIDSIDEGVLEAAALKLTEELKADGANPYFIPIGGSNSIGSLGYIAAFHEIMEYCEEEGVDFRKIYVAAGSAGTQAGLSIGQIMYGWEGALIGISAGRIASDQSELVFKVIHETMQYLAVEASMKEIRESIIVDDNYVGEGYRKKTKACRESIELFARREGIFLDEVYTGKAAAGLIDHARKGTIATGENVLFIHTGGTMQLFE